MKKAYKQLRKKLKNSFTPISKGNEYKTYGGVGEWFIHSGIKPTSKHLNIVCTIFGSVPYPFQEQDRKVILKYLRKHKYKEFKSEFTNSI